MIFDRDNGTEYSFINRIGKLPYLFDKAKSQKIDKLENLAERHSPELLPSPETYSELNLTSNM